MGASESKAPAGTAAVAAAMSGDSQAFSLASQNGIDSADAQGNTALIAAAFAGNDALALQLINAKADISKQNDTGCDATWVAAAYGKADVLKTLLAAGGSALTCNKQADSALMAAVMKGHEGTVQLLLQAGAAVAHKNKNGDSAISVGVSSAFSALPALLDAIAASDTSLLLLPNAKNVSPLHAACSLSSPLSAVVVPQLLAACSSRSCAPAALAQTDANGASPLLVAAHCGNASAIDALLTCAHDHGLLDFAAAFEGSGKSSLWLAAAAGHAAAVQSLLKARAWDDAAHALQVAQQNGHTACVALLQQ